ncbi:MAG: DUF3567 domain-containing protein [Aquabacterium sp.]
MQIMYQSDQFVVVAFEVDAATPAAEGVAGLRRGGYEIVDKFARKEIFLEGALAEHFQQGVRSLVDGQAGAPDADEIDAFIGGYTQLAQQPVVMH